MQTKNQVLEKLQFHQTELEQFGVKSIGIFGSYVKSEATENSDIDIFIDFKKGLKSFRNYTGAYFFLNDIFKKKIDFITPQSLSKYIGSSIINNVEYAFRND